MASFDTLENQATELKAQAARERARADENLKKALEDLERLIRQYEEGLTVCPQIKALMIEHPSFKECYPRYWNLCAL
ncbi:MAG: hypothetical protein HC769_18920 [Cyanobacteria bacterium CRU_2_1]|nr:hypothetical protein [Cyanobacteria bacterium CRU_2_1]